jgi:hypothetical protein
MYLIGEFHQTDFVAAAIRSLRADGIAAGDVDLFSHDPVELPPGVLDRPSRMSLVSVLGAIMFGLTATTFVYWAQHNYKLTTGGMPIFSFWATGVITYEMTMLGAILATFTWFLWESGLLRKRDRSAPVPKVVPGSICLRVCCPAERSVFVTDAMRRAGAAGIERSI